MFTRLVCIGAIVAATTAACVTAPTDDGRIAHYDTPIKFQGFASKPNSAVIVKVKNQSTGDWELLATATSLASPTVAAGTYTTDNPNLYAWSVTAAISSAENAAGLCRWSPSCSPPGKVEGDFRATLQIEEPGGDFTQQLVTFDQEGLNCITDKTRAGMAFLLAAGQCRSQHYPDLHVDVRYHWLRTEGLQTQASPALSAHTDNRLYMAAVADDGLVRVTSTQKPGAWAVWQTLWGAPGAGFDLSTPPVFVRDGTVLYVFVRGADNNLYRASKNGALPWTSLTALITDSSVRGRVEVASSRSSRSTSETHIVYTGLSGVQYARFTGSTLASTRVWLGALDGVVATDGQDRLFVAIRRTSSVETQRADRGTGWNFGAAGTDGASGVYDLSNAVFFDDAFHVLVARRQMVSPGTYEYELVDRKAKLTAEFTVGFVTLTRLATYKPVADRHVAASLVVYRNKLVTAFRDPTGAVRRGRLDNADPAAPWIVGGAVEEAVTDFRPALASFDARPVLAPVDYRYSNFGDDTFVAVPGKDMGGRIAFINFSRALFRYDFDAQFTLYDTSDDTLCDPVAPHMSAMSVPDLWLEGRPVLSEVGYNLWMFPNWFVKDLFRDFTEVRCSNGEWGADDLPCKTQKLPVYLKDSGNLFVCRGAWVNYSSPYMRVFEELGHYMAAAIGLSDNNSGPDTTHAARTGIALAVLENAYDLFAERTGQCGGVTGRCRGFTGIGDNYDAGSRQHSFIYVAYYYIRDGDQLRTWIAQDVAAGDTLLQRKYNWIKNNIFRGVAFKRDALPL
jgi:hypothetical protein